MLLGFDFVENLFLIYITLYVSVASYLTSGAFITLNITAKMTNVWLICATEPVYFCQVYLVSVSEAMGGEQSQQEQTEEREEEVTVEQHQESVEAHSSAASEGEL